MVAWSDRKKPDKMDGVAHEVRYIGNVLIDRLSGQTIGKIDERKGTIRLINGSTHAVFEVTVRRIG